jgi:hypothetical protein
MGERPGWDPAQPYVPGRGFTPPPAVVVGVPEPTASPGRSRGIGILVAVAAVMAVALVGWLAVRPPQTSPAGAVPLAQASGLHCPTYPRTSVVGSEPGRVRSGRLTYPELPAPWTRPEPIGRTPFTTDAVWQWIATESDAGGKPTWISAIEVSELASGDGMPQPADAYERVIDCLTGTYETAVTRTYVTSHAATVTGRPAWYAEIHLSYDKPGVAAKGEVLMVMIVRTAPDSTGMLRASIPDGNPAHLADARTAFADLRVG